MVIHLSDESEQILRAMMETQCYASEREVIAEALRLLYERHEQGKLESLRRDLAHAAEQLDRGEWVPFDPEGILERVRARRTTTADFS